ncbi:MAG TPA: Ku protein [Gemmatimonadales bacterium]|nr:Ku protein [Gemmatimonadales bacterium]
MRRAAVRPKPQVPATWSGPLLLGLQRLRIELRPTWPGGKGALASPARAAGPARPGTPEERLEILGFVSTSELSWIHLDRPYYLSSPDENTRLYTVLREILVRSDRLAVGQLVLRRRRHLVAIYGFRGALVVHLLRASTEVLDPRTLGVPTAETAGAAEWTASPWVTQPEAGEQQAPHARRPMLRARRTGTASPIAREVDGARVLDLTAALKRRREIAAAHPGHPTPPRRPQPTGSLPGPARRAARRV